MAEVPSPLSGLADIVEPPFQHNFALAPVWWLLIVMLISALLYLLWRWRKRHRFFLAKRQAQAQLLSLQHADNSAADINQLLKRVLQHYQPGHPALSANSTQWQLWLAQQQVLPLPNLSELLYQPQHDKQQLKLFYQFAWHWLANYTGKADTELPPVAIVNSDQLQEPAHA